MTAAAAFFPDDRKFVSSETYDAFFAVVGRLEAAVDAETRALASGRNPEVAELTRQKRQGLLELNRLMKAMERAIPSQDIIAKLAGFRRKLGENDAALRVHLQAVREVNALIVKVMREADSDGTYSRGDIRSNYDDA